MNTFKFLGVHITEDHTCFHNTAHLCRILSSFYRCTIESILSSSITVWFGSCTSQDCKTLQWNSPTRPGSPRGCTTSLSIKDNSLPQHSLFTLLPSGRHYRSAKARLNTHIYMRTPWTTTKPFTCLHCTLFCLLHMKSHVYMVKCLQCTYAPSLAH